MLLLLALGRDLNHRAWLLAHDTDPMPTGAATRYAELVHRRLAGEPVAYLAGAKAFYGLNLQVDPRVLVPRPDTETLVQWALDLLAPTPARPRFLDLGTGSGAIALAVKSQRPDVAVSATDVSADALTVARSNAERLGLAVDFHAGSWLHAVPGHRFDVIASNPPYIAEGDHVVMCGRYSATARATGLPVNPQAVHVWTLRDGKATAFQQHVDTLGLALATGRVALA